MLLLSKRRKVIIGGAVLVLVLVLAGALVYFYIADKNNDQSDLPYSDPNQLIQEIEDNLADRTRLRYDEAETPTEKMNARLELTTLAIQKDDLEEALVYAEEAVAVEGLEVTDRYSALMNLVNIYGLRGEYEAGLNQLAAIRADASLMGMEQAEFYVSRYENAFRENKVPGPINCIEPQQPGDCPV